MILHVKEYFEPDNYYACYDDNGRRYFIDLTLYNRVVSKQNSKENLIGKKVKIVGLIPCIYVAEKVEVLPDE